MPGPGWARSFRRAALWPVLAFVVACAPITNDDTPTRASAPISGLPAIKLFTLARPTPPARSNRDIARDFMDLAFLLESGRSLGTFSRFEGPITVRITGTPPPTLIPDLDRLIARLRREAGIDISRTRRSGANITVQAVSRSEIRKHLPKAACFVVPNISRLSDYRAAKRNRSTNWSLLKTRQKLAVFLPNDVSPQEARDCLHEELAQAIGPLNDLYRLPDSVFNDDNVHTVLTGFDMLILRAYYAPELQSGMSRDQVAARLPGILARLNPAGARRAPQMLPMTPRNWINAIHTALGPAAHPAHRLNAARQTVTIARNQGWTDHRRAFSHFALGRLTVSTNTDFAQNQLLAADMYYRRTPGTELHRAHVAVHLAAIAIGQHRAREALVILSPHVDTAKRYENAALLANLMLLRAEALRLSGQPAKAQTVRLDSLGWARYGFGTDWAVRAKLHEISKLNPARGSNG